MHQKLKHRPSKLHQCSFPRIFDESRVYYIYASFSQDPDTRIQIGALGILHVYIMCKEGATTTIRDTKPGSQKQDATYQFISSDQLVPKEQKTHEDPIWKQLLHFDEVASVFFLLVTRPIKSSLVGIIDEDLRFCDQIMGKVARPYAIAIRQLPLETAVNVMILHHALRALDTIEDDMTAFPSNDIKIQHLQTFVGTALTDPTWSMHGVGEGDEALLLQEFPKVNRVFQCLPSEVQAIIKDITHRMAMGMCEFIVDRNFQGPLDFQQYDRYCHWVAGLVAEGLIRLFAFGGLERPSFATELKLADNVGLFLQKVNIIRDFLEDFNEQRVFWPQSVWSKYTRSLSCFDTPSKADAEMAVQCLNELVANALMEVPHIVAFLSKMQCVETYRFFALLLLGAFATLKECYNNPNIFTGKVRIRKGLACQMALVGHDPDAVMEWFWVLSTHIKQTSIALIAHGEGEDPSREQTIRVCDQIARATQTARNRRQVTRQWHWIFFVIILLCPLLFDTVFDQAPEEHPLQMVLQPLLFVATAVMVLNMIWPSTLAPTPGPQQLREASSIFLSAGRTTNIKLLRK
jgi:farnesyl-diphosphate farnesyltransferase